MFVVNCSMGTGLLMGGMVYVYYKFGPKRRYKARLRDMRSLRWGGCWCSCVVKIEKCGTEPSGTSWL